MATASPLAVTLGRLGAVDGGLPAHVDGAPAEAVTLAQLAADVVRIDELVGRVCAGSATTDRGVGASFLFGDLAWRVAAASLVPLIAERRLPLAVGLGLALTFDADGESVEAFLPGTGFAAMPDDPAAGHPDARGVASYDRLRGLARARVVGTLEPLVAAFRPRARRSLSSLWGEVCDAIASVCRWGGERLGCEALGMGEAERLLDGTPPLRGGCNWTSITHAGRSETWRVRNTCCLAYKLADHGYCFTCPLPKPDERLARWCARVDELNQEKA